MAVIQEAITEGGKYVTPENSLGHVRIKEVLRIIPDKQDHLRDIIEYQARVVGSNAPWIKNRCTRKTFANSIAGIATKTAA